MSLKESNLSWNLVAELGISSDLPDSQRDLWKIFNQLIGISFITFVVFIPMAGIFESVHYLLVLLSGLVVQFICLLLNGKGLFKLSSVLFMTCLIVALGFIAMFTGVGSVAYLGLIPISTLPLLFSNSRLGWILTFTSCILMSALVEFNILKIQPAEVESWKTTLLHFAIVIGVLIVGYFYNKFFKDAAFRKDKLLIGLNNQIASRNNEILGNISVARDIQTSLLPLENDFKDLFPRSFIFYRPRDMVSGDFYWTERHHEMNYCAVIDCTGHGVPGAFVSIIGHQGLNRCIYDYHLTEPADILNKLHELMFQMLSKEDNQILDGMDMVLIRLDQRSKKMTFSGAHNSALIVRNNDLSMDDLEVEYRGLNHSLFKVKGQRQSVGSEYLKEPFRQVEIDLKHEDMIYLYTDGYVDQFGGSHFKKMMHKPFKKLLLGLQDLPLSFQEMEVREYFDNWKQGNDQIDDVCVIGIQYMQY